MKVLNRLDNSLDLPEEECMLLDAVRVLCRDQIRPRASAYDQSGEFPLDNIHGINELGLNGMFIPENYGGAEMSYCAYLAAVREIGKACASTGLIWGTTFHATKPVIDFATETQKMRFLPQISQGGIASLCITEPTAGSDATHMKTRFSPKGSEIIIQGGKTFISSGDHADLFL